MVSKYLQTSENCFIDSSNNLLSKHDFISNISKDQQVNVLPYFDIKSSQEIIGYSIKEDRDIIRNYSEVHTFKLGANTICSVSDRLNLNVYLDFYNPYEQKRYTFHCILNDYSEMDGYHAQALTFTLNSNSCNLIQHLYPDKFKKVLGLSTIKVYYNRKRSKGELELCVGLPCKKFALSYEGTDYSVSRYVFFYGYFGCLLDDDLNITAIFTFNGYNNDRVSIAQFLYLADPIVAKHMLVHRNKGGN